MRVKRVAAVAVLLVLTGCSGSPQGPSEPDDDSFNVRAVQTKLRALGTDACYTDPASKPPPSCEKYTTQARNLASTLGDGAEHGYPDLAGPSRGALDGVGRYRDGDCSDDKPPSTQDCVTALRDVATAFDEAAEVVDAR